MEVMLRCKRCDHATTLSLTVKSRNIMEAMPSPFVGLTDGCIARFSGHDELMLEPGCSTDDVPSDLRRIAERMLEMQPYFNRALNLR